MAAALVFLGLLFYPTELIPWGVTAPAFAATLLALAVTAKDGILALIGCLMTVASVVLVIYFWPF